MAHLDGAAGRGPAGPAEYLLPVAVRAVQGQTRGAASLATKGSWEHRAKAGCFQPHSHAATLAVVSLPDEAPDDPIDPLGELGGPGQQVGLELLERDCAHRITIRGNQGHFVRL